MAPVSIEFIWSRVPATNNSRFFIYSPRFGSTYLVGEEYSKDRFFQALLGLRKAVFVECLIDPAQNVDHCLVSSAEPSVEVEGRDFYLEALYDAIHKSRRIIPFTSFAKTLAWFTRLQKKESRTISEIGHIIQRTEKNIGFSDCYPRSLLTAYLCLRSNLSCELVIGILSPSHKMHAWCSVGGVIPFEPMAEHWMYRPLLVVQANIIDSNST